MIVCHCKGVSDRAIRQAVRDGACSRRQVGRACGAGRTCGGCVPSVLEILSEELDAQPAPLRALPGLGEAIAAPA